MVSENMKNRNLPYGYSFTKGSIVVQPQEQAIVAGIYDGYLSGKSLSDITSELNVRSVEFMPGVIGWNKARLKHILEDERYRAEHAERCGSEIGYFPNYRTRQMPCLRQ